MRLWVIAATGLLGAGPVGAQALVGDAAAGEEHFGRQCIACHVVQDAAGEVLAGRNAQVGPNLYGVVGRVAGGLEDYDYSELMATYSATGAVWEEANFVAYLQDPTGYLREATGEGSGRSKMAYQVRDEQQAYDLYAYLATFSPEGAEDAGGEAPAEGEAASE
jgi:cytochrome c